MQIVKQVNLKKISPISFKKLNINDDQPPANKYMKPDKSARHGVGGLCIYKSFANTY